MRTLVIIMRQPRYLKPLLISIIACHFPCMHWRQDIAFFNKVGAGEVATHIHQSLFSLMKFLSQFAHRSRSRLGPTRNIWKGGFSDRFPLRFRYWFLLTLDPGVWPLPCLQYFYRWCHREQVLHQLHLVWTSPWCFHYEAGSIHDPYCSGIWDTEGFGETCAMNAFEICNCSPHQPFLVVYSGHSVAPPPSVKIRTIPDASTSAQHLSIKVTVSCCI